MAKCKIRRAKALSRVFVKQGYDDIISVIFKNHCI